MELEFDFSFPRSCGMLAALAALTTGYKEIKDYLNSLNGIIILERYCEFFRCFFDRKLSRLLGEINLEGGAAE